MIKKLFLLLALLVSGTLAWANGETPSTGNDNDDGGVVIATHPRGDVNGDTKVTIADVTALVNIILGKSTDVHCTADINGDGKITIADVTALVNIILGKDPGPGGHEVDHGEGA